MSCPPSPSVSYRAPVIPSFSSSDDLRWFVRVFYGPCGWKDEALKLFPERANKKCRCTAWTVQFLIENNIRFFVLIYKIYMRSTRDPNEIPETQAIWGNYMIQCVTAWITDISVFYMDVGVNKLPLISSWKSRPDYFGIYLALFQMLGFTASFTFLFGSACPLRTDGLNLTGTNLGLAPQSTHPLSKILNGLISAVSGLIPVMNCSSK